MATKQIVLNKAMLAEVAKIDKHLAKFKAGKGVAAASAGDKLCTFYAKGKPILVLLGAVLGKTAGASVIAGCAAIEAYCAMAGEGLIIPGDAKSNKAIAALCKGFAKVSPFIDLGVMIFGNGKGEWAKILTGLSTGLKTLCATPGE